MRRFMVLIGIIGLFAAMQIGAAATPLPGGQAAPASDPGKDLLMKVYMDAARVHDLLDATQTANWKMTDAERGQFQQEAQSIDGGLQTLEKWRYQFYYHPEDTDAAAKTLAALNDLIPQVGQIAKDAQQYGGNAAAPYEHAASNFSAARDSLASYLQTKFPDKFPPQAQTPAPSAAAAPQPSQPAAAQTPQAAQSSQAAQPSQPAQPVQTAPTSGNNNAAKETAAAPPENAAPPTQPAQATPSAQPGATTQTTATPPAESAAAPASSSTGEQASASAPAPTAAAAATTSAPASPDQVKALLRGVYLTDARVSDLLTLLQPEKWKMADAERAMFSERLGAVRNQLAEVEKWRYQFLYHIGQTDLGAKTVAALGDLVPGILAMQTSVAQYNGKATGDQFAQAASQLATARNTLASYVAYVVAEAQKQLAAPPAGLPGGKGLETERINARPSAPPVSSLAVEQPPLTPGQVKSILYKVYISEFRIRDLLSQEHPSAWKGASDAERTMAAQSRAALATQLSELEKWRARFSEHPGNMYDAFETYRAVNAIFHPLRVFGREAGKYENQNMADDYSRREADMEAQLNGLVPYIGFILQHQDRNLEMFQADLAGCQNQLGYAMHGMVHSSQPMKNIVPVFQGRRVDRKKDARPVARKKTGTRSEKR